MQPKLGESSLTYIILSHQMGGIWWMVLWRFSTRGIDVLSLLLGAALENFLLENPKKLFLVPHTQPKLGESSLTYIILSHQMPYSLKSTPVAKNS
jgi:hypothetical protein